MTSTTSALKGRGTDASATPVRGRDQAQATAGDPTAVPAPVTVPETAPPAPPETDRRRWIALAVVMTAAFMDLVDVTIVNIAIPSIQRGELATFSQIQWITAGYALAFAAGLVTGGRLGDIHGRRRIFLVGIGGFTLASAHPLGLRGRRIHPETRHATNLDTPFPTRARLRPISPR